MAEGPAQHFLSPISQSLLEKVLDDSASSGSTALKYRADNYAHVRELDEMERAGWLRRESGRYRVSGSVLPLLAVPAATSVLAALEPVYTAVRNRYRRDQDKPVVLSELADELGMPRDALIANLELMKDISVWCAGYSNDFQKEDAFVAPSESILRNASFGDLAREVNSWSRELVPPPALVQDRAELSSHTQEPTEIPPDREMALPPLLAQNVLAAADDLAELQIEPNDYLDDLEPQAFLDNIVNGKLRTLLAYCDSIGWRGLSKQLRELLPARGDAPEAMELVRNFIVPEVRRLVISPSAASPAPEQASDVLPAWSAVRACLQEFSFYDIKALAGLSGLDVTALAHLDQKAQGGASKGQLMTAVDAAYGAMSATNRAKFLTLLIEVILRRRPAMEESLAEYLSRLGWAFMGQRLVPTTVLRPETLDDTPEVCRADLLKAAQRLRDGDMTGAISAACGAVDSATSQVYRELGLGDPNDASFQERCKRAAQARGVLLGIGQQLQKLGWEKAEIVPFHKNLEGALNQGAYVMQTLRSHMGDVHGSKPILRSLVFDCLRWAELLVGALVQRDAE